MEWTEPNVKYLVRIYYLDSSIHPEWEGSSGGVDEIQYATEHIDLSEANEACKRILLNATVEIEKLEIHAVRVSRKRIAQQTVWERMTSLELPPEG